MQSEKIFEKVDFGHRTKQFALATINLYSCLPQSVAAQVIGKQMLRSATSVGAQYREARRARSRAEFVSKLDSALQELEETEYWFELLSESAIVPHDKLKPLFIELKQIAAILTTSSKTAKANAMKEKLKDKS